MSVHPSPPVAQNWVMLISEQHRYQGVSYKSDIIVLSGLDPGDRQVLEQKYSGCDPPCLLDSSDGRFVLKGPGYNPMDVLNCLGTRRGYKVQGQPQQRTLPNIHNKDDKFAMIYHLAKDALLKRAHTIPGNLGLAKPLPVTPVDPTKEGVELTRQVPCGEPSAWVPILSPGSASSGNSGAAYSNNGYLINL